MIGSCGKAKAIEQRLAKLESHVAEVYSMISHLAQGTAANLNAINELMKHAQTLHRMIEEAADALPGEQTLAAPRARRKRMH